MLRSRVAARLTLVLIAMAAFVGCVAVISFVRRGIHRAAVPDEPPPQFTVAWQRIVGPLTRISYSSNGAAFCTLTAEGDLSVYSSDGRKRYTVRFPDATAAVVADDGRFAMAYSARDPSRPVLTFLDSDGRVHWELTVAGAVWSADAWADAEGATFVAGTGERYVYVIEVGRHRKRFRRWKAPGAVTSVAIDPDGRQVTFATWQPSAIGRATLRGRRVWQVDAEPAHIHQVEALRSEGCVLVRSAANRPGVDGGFALLDGDGKEFSRGTISAQEGTRVLAAPNGRYVCLAQERLIEHEGKSVREKHAVLLDAAGRTLVDKGSIFFEADPLLVTGQGAVLLAGAKNAVFTMTASGKLEVAAKAPAKIKRCLCSRDGTRALIECEGGRLLMLTSCP